MKMTAKELAQTIVHYCEVNNLKGKKRDSAAHAMAYAAAMVAEAEGQTDFRGLAFVLSIRGYEEAHSLATRKEEIADEAE